MSTGRQLAQGPSGVGRLVLTPEGNPDQKRETMIACWQGVDRAIPQRLIVRCDGHIQDWRDFEGVNMGYPCAVLRVDYSIGGYQIGGAGGVAVGSNAPAMRTLFVDAVNQSALTIWATSVEVVPVWDRRRISRLAAFYDQLESGSGNPCKQQHLAVAISACDYGPGNARWLDVVSFLNESEVENNGLSIHPVPPGARACRLLNATRSDGSIFEITDVLTAVQWATFPNPDEPSSTNYVHQDTPSHCALDVPATASHLFLRFEDEADVNQVTPFWVEWILSPEAI
jgi:hypothetical protein